MDRRDQAKSRQQRYAGRHGKQKKVLTQQKQKNKKKVGTVSLTKTKGGGQVVSLGPKSRGVGGATRVGNGSVGGFFGGGGKARGTVGGLKKRGKKP